MRLSRLFLLPALLLSLSALLPATALAQVKASLVAAETAIVPGKPVQVALRLVHQPHWHTYWINPGTGLVTEIKWSLPPGWTASAIQWPAPHVIKDKTGTVTGNGFENDTLLPVTLTPPAGLTPGATITLKASAEWLMCEDVCMPGNADVTLTLPVAATTSPDPTFGATLTAVVAGLPRADAAWKTSASRDTKTITLKVAPAGPTAGKTAGKTAAPADLRFSPTITSSPTNSRKRSPPMAPAATCSRFPFPPKPRKTPRNSSAFSPTKKAGSPTAPSAASASTCLSPLPLPR